MSIKRRLGKLEERRGPTKHTIGTQIGDGPVKVRGEKMSEAEFVRRHPNGILVRFADDAPPPDYMPASYKENTV